MSDHVVVIGGGITGLVAALRLEQAGRSVTVLEATDRPGGKLQTTAFRGVEGVDTGGDAMLARVPWGVDLLAELGLEAVSPAVGTALVAWHGRLHRLPEGLILGVPAGLGGLARSRLLSPLGKLRAATEPFRRRTKPTDNLGELIRARFGDEVADRLVDPLVGGINAGDIDHLSISAATPQLMAATADRSLLRGLSRNRPPTSAAPVFVAPRGGMGSLATEVAGRLTDLRVSTPCSSIERRGRGWTVNGIDAGHVIVATPAHVTAGLLHGLSPDTAAGLRQIRAASVVMVTLAYPRATIGRALTESGFLIPKSAQGHVTACSFGSNKWPHWARNDEVVLRVSLGRLGNDAPMSFDDDRTATVAHSEIAGLLGITSEPSAAHVTRWERAFPQYEPGHRGRVATLRTTLAVDARGLLLAGAPYDGIGVPACIRQAEEAVRSITQNGHEQ